MIGRNKGKSDKQYPEEKQLNSLLYRFGYIAKAQEPLHIPERLKNKLPNWSLHSFNDLSLFVHPELPVTFSSVGQISIVILGRVFNPFKKELNAQTICNQLSKAPKNSEEFFDLLDELSGRHVVFAKIDDTWYAFPDGFSSKMRYFSKEKCPTLSSHINLLAEVTGASIDYEMYAFITSEAYKKKDVKNLPGLKTEFENLYVAPANHSVSLSTADLERFWPRQNLSHKDTTYATDCLIQYLDGYSDYIALNFDEEIFGLTGGMDSRTMIAPLLAKEVHLSTFTQLRGSQSNIQDLRTAKELAKKFNFGHKVIDVSSEAARINGFFSKSREILRTNGGPHRLNTIFSTDALYNAYKDSNKVTNYSRGFGGEILRGFHQKNGDKLKTANAEHFSRILSIHAESPVAINAFAEQIKMLDYQNCHDADLYDLFYMEHRMSKWGANSLNETDVAVHTMVGFNSRKLYGVHMGLPIEVRATREVFKQSIMHFHKELLSVDIV